MTGLSALVNKNGYANNLHFSPLSLIRYGNVYESEQGGSPPYMKMTYTFLF